MDKDLQGILAFAAFVIALVTVAGIFRTWIKSRAAQPSADADRRMTEVLERLSRMETAIDATALEVERIAEGQRFTTKLLSDKAGVRVDR